MSDPLESWWVHLVLVERYNGSEAYGDDYDTGETVTGFVHDKTKIVVGPDGQQVVASTQVALPAGTAYVPVKSRVTLPAQFGNRRAIVVDVSVGDGGGRPTPDHVELALI